MWDTRSPHDGDSGGEWQMRWQASPFFFILSFLLCYFFELIVSSKRPAMCLGPGLTFVFRGFLSRRPWLIACVLHFWIWCRGLFFFLNPGIRIVISAGPLINQFTSRDHPPAHDAGGFEFVSTRAARSKASRLFSAHLSRLPLLFDCTAEHNCRAVTQSQDSIQNVMPC